MTVAPFAPNIAPARVEPDPVTVKMMSDLDAVASTWSRELKVLDSYQRGCQDARFMAKAAQEVFGQAITQLILNFPALVVASRSDRLDVEGFRFPGESGGDDDLWAIWQANNMDEQSVMGHDEALGLSRAAVIVGASPDRDGAPVMTVESPFDVSWIRDPATGRAVKGQKKWFEGDKSEWRTVYDLNRTQILRRDGDGWRLDRPAIQHDLGRLPLIPLVNQPRIKLRDGRSAFADILGLSDAANKIATDMMTSAEHHATPRRWAFGLKKADFQNADGTPKNMWKFITGYLWANESPDIKVGQFSESDLSNFHNTIKLLARLVGQLTALPIDYLAFDSVNPPSADALRAAESRLVKAVERCQVTFGGSWEEAQRVALLTQGKSLPDGAMSLETVWRDAATPTIAQKYDAVVKAVTTMGADGRPLVPTEQGRIDLGYTPAQRKDMREMEDDAAARDPLTASLAAPSVTRDA